MAYSPRYNNRRGGPSMQTKCWDWVKQMVNEIADLTDAAAASDVFQKWLKFQSAFHHYSYYNTMLIAIQNPSATKVMGGKSWQKVGRRVKDDQWKKKIWILAPILRNVDPPRFNSAGKPVKELKGFRGVYVFDVAQTEGDPMPTLDYRVEGEDNGLVEALEGEYKRRGIALEYVDTLGGAKGVSTGGKVKLLNSLKGAERGATLAHELGHEILHWNTEKGNWYENHSRSTAEIEAESVAAVIMGAWGLEYAASSMYLACWKGDGKKVRESMGKIVKASKDVLGHILPE